MMTTIPSLQEVRGWWRRGGRGWEVFKAEHFGNDKCFIYVLMLIPFGSPNYSMTVSYIWYVTSGKELECASAPVSAPSNTKNTNTNGLL